MEIKNYRIKEKILLTKGNVDSHPIYSFKLEPLDGLNFNFIPGQFITIFKENENLFRSYSIASSPDQPYLELLIEMIDGKLTSYLNNKVVGDILRIGEPRGNFVLGNNKKLVFLAAGVGIAPFFSMLRYLNSKNEKRDIVMFYSVKHVDDIVDFHELESYSNLDLKLIINVTRDNVVPDGFTKGRINSQEIMNKVSDYKDRDFYICGGLGFARDLKENLIKIGIDQNNIKSDIWGENDGK